MYAICFGCCSQNYFFDAMRFLALEFVSGYEKLYGKEYMVFSIHQIFHIVDCVANWGLLGGYSAFSFEDMDGHILRLFHGTQNVNWQISEEFIISVTVPVFGKKVNG